MPFDAEIIISGLVLAKIDSSIRGNPNRPDGVEILAMKDFVHSHTALMSFAFEDLTRAIPSRFEVTMSSDGTPTISKDVAHQTIEVQAFGGANDPEHFSFSASANPQAPNLPDESDCLDWIPDLTADFGIAAVRLPSEDLRSDPLYISRLVLPKGHLSSRTLLVNPEPYQQFATWEFYRGTQRMAIKPIAEKIVWSRRGLTALQVNFPGHKLKFDAASRQRRGDTSPVQLCFSNMPKHGVLNPFGAPQHFSHYIDLEPSSEARPKNCHASSELRVVRVQPVADHVTDHGGCPPVKIGTP